MMNMVTQRGLCLTNLCSIIKRELYYRESDIIARIGGDEFVLLPVGTTKDGIEVIRNRFYTVLSNFNDTHDYPWTLSATIGIAYFDPESLCSTRRTPGACR